MRACCSTSPLWQWEVQAGGTHHIVSQEPDVTLRVRELRGVKYTGAQLVHDLRPGTGQDIFFNADLHLVTSPSLGSFFFFLLTS